MSEPCLLPLLPECVHNTSLVKANRKIIQHPMIQWNRLLLTTLASIASHSQQQQHHCATTTVPSKASSPTISAAAAAAAAATIKFEELLLPCLDGMILSAQKYSTVSTEQEEEEEEGGGGGVEKQQHQQQHCTTTATTKRILCLHGWLDNCRSFYSLVPAIVKEFPRAEIVALDFPGHGWSHHKSAQSPPTIVQAELAFYVQEALHALDWWRPQQQQQQQQDDNNNKMETILLPTTILMGHSLGAGVSSLFAAGFPEQVDRLILLDGAGFVARPASQTAEFARNHILNRRQTLVQQQQQRQQVATTIANDVVLRFHNPKEYSSLQVAIKTRRRAALVLPQKNRKLLPAKVAEEMVIRSTRPVNDHGLCTSANDIIMNNNNNNNNNNNSSAAAVQFTHDARFHGPSLLYMTWDQVQGIFNAIRSDVCLLVAQEGWPFDPAQLDRTKELLQPVMYRELPGCHYFHADPETADAVAEAVVQFLKVTDAKAVKECR